MKKKWLFIGISLLVLVTAGIVGLYYYQAQVSNAQAATTETAMQTSEAHTGDLVIYASGTGQVTPAKEISVGFDESGTLIELNVAAGDIVQAGKLLARLQTKNSPEEIAVSISDAELSFIQAKQSIDDLYANAEIARTTAMNDISTYAQAVRDAQYQLENYSPPLILQGMDAIAAVDKMKMQLDAASQAFEPFRYYPADNETRRDLLVALNLAQSNYDAAVKRLNYEYELQVAEANLEKARQEYEKFKDGPADDDLAIAQATLDSAEAKLNLAREAQAVIELAAPMDGTVMDVSASVGEELGAASFITLADLKQPMLVVYLDETDLDKVAVGYEAEVVFDALPDQTFTGKVIAVSPGLETVQNVAAVKVLVQLDDSNHDATLPVGMNASVDIISGRAQNAVLVPVEALRELGSNEYAVFVVVDGQPVLRPVEVGLMDITFAEIKSGLEAGEVVSTGIVETK